MLMKMSWTTTSAAACAVALSLELVAVTGGFRTHAPAPSVETHQVQGANNSPSQVVLPQNSQPQATPTAATQSAGDDRYYAQLRSRIRWVETRFGGDMLMTPDAGSRVMLAKSAAERAGLDEVGLNFEDVYGIVNAETSWVPRLGASKDGTPNLGLAQFEPATARALGLRNPNDPVEAIQVAALHMKEAAEWSASRLAGLKLGAVDRARKLREGVSIFYNLSTKGRNRWNGTNTAKLPIETRLHIRNARTGAQHAAELEAKLVSAGFTFTGG
jgi:hypothetical protein